MSRRKLIATAHTRSEQHHAMVERGHTPLPLDLAAQLPEVDALVVGLAGVDIDHSRAIDREVLDELRDLKPHVLLWEQAAALTMLRHERVLQQKLDVCHLAHYVATYKVLDRGRFGGAPGRRLWIVATNQRRDLPEHPRLPKSKGSYELAGDPVIHALLEANHL